ncbi:hypothetical protein LXL04_003360 [Taraxacum kok-saghyz]
MPLGMADFLNEMATMMNQNKPNVETSFAELKDLFEEMFEIDTESSFGLSSEPKSFAAINKRGSSEMSKSMVEDGWCFKTDDGHGRYKEGEVI